MLDNSGFTRRSYQEILNEIMAQAQNTIAPDIDICADSILGALFRVMAFELAKEEELQEAVWYSGFVSQATGVSLDHLAANIGLTRNQGQNSVVKLTINGVAGAVVPEKMLLSTPNNIQFYSVDSGPLVATGQLDTDGKTALGTLTVKAVSVVQSVTANVAANQITRITQAIDGIRSVNNSNPAIGGVEVESDSALRNRLLDNFKKSENGTVNALVAAIENVTGVQMAQVVVNNTMTVDSYGNAPKSVHFYVQGGTNKDIANAIFNNIVAGVATNGAISVPVTNIAGTYTQNISFDRPSQYVVDLAIKLVTNSAFSINGNAAVTAAIQAYFATMKIGEPLYFSKLVAAAYTVSGIDDVEITASNMGTAITGTVFTPQQFQYVVAGNIGVTE